MGVRAAGRMAVRAAARRARGEPEWRRPRRAVKCS